LVTWPLLALGAALFYGLQGVWTKRLTRDVPPVVAAWALFAFGFPLLAAYLAIRGVPDVSPVFWLALLTTCSIGLLAYSLYASAIQRGDVGLTVPLLALTPVLLVPVEWLLLGDVPGPRGLGGILLVVAGVYLLNLRDLRGHPLAPLAAPFRDPGARRMLAVAVLWSVTGVVDKIAVTASSPAFYGTMQSAILGVAFLPLIARASVARRAPDPGTAPDRGPEPNPGHAQVRRHWPALALQGLLHATMFIVQMEALRLTLAANVITIKRSGALVTVLLGALVFGERDLRKRLLGTLLTVIGVMLVARG
jgi:drug/metabolite transporter (DMT)-like permease